MEINFKANAIKELYEVCNLPFDDKKGIESDIIFNLFLYIGEIKGILYKRNCLFVNFETKNTICVECENFANALCRIILLIWNDMYNLEKENIKKILMNEKELKSVEQEIERKIMKTVEEITEILLHHFSDVYCDTCGADEDKCDYCHRKSMMWKLDKLTANKIAKEILGE